MIPQILFIYFSTLSINVLADTSLDVSQQPTFKQSTFKELSFKHQSVQDKTSLTIIDTEAHDPNWFTQGLFKEKDSIFISSGLYGKSAVIIQKYSPPQIKRYRLPKNYFAEGLTVIGDTLYLLSWKEETLFLFDKTTLTLKDKIHYKGEGWGLTHTNEKNGFQAEFIMSNGSDTIYFRDINTFKIKRKLKVKNLNFINELEYHKGIIWANRWYDNHLYGIDSQSGCIVAKVDLLPLRKLAGNINNKNIVNGVAYDPNKNGLWVTGKLWSKRFLIDIPYIDYSQCPLN